MKKTKWLYAKFLNVVDEKKKYFNSKQKKTAGIFIREQRRLAVGGKNKIT